MYGKLYSMLSSMYRQNAKHVGWRSEFLSADSYGLSGTRQICCYTNMKNIQRVSIWDRLNEGWELYLLQVRDTPCDPGTSWNCMWKACWCSYTPHHTFIGTRLVCGMHILAYQITKIKKYVFGVNSGTSYRGISYSLGAPIKFYMKGMFTWEPAIIHSTYSHGTRHCCGYNDNKFDVEKIIDSKGNLDPKFTLFVRTGLGGTRSRLYAYPRSARAEYTGYYLEGTRLLWL